MFETSRAYVFHLDVEPYSSNLDEEPLEIDGYVFLDVLREFSTVID